MPSQVQVSVGEFEQSLTPEALRATQIVQIGILVGPIIFAAIVLAIYSIHSSDVAAQTDLDLFELLTGLTVCFGLFAFVIGNFLFRRTFSPEAIFEGLSSDTRSRIADRCVSIQRTAILVRLALLEGASFFGLVICLKGAVSGVLASAPKFWLNLAPLAAMVLFGLVTFPTKAKLTSWFESRIVNR